MKQKMEKLNFTLIELVLILAIMAILTTLLVQVMSTGMQRVKDTECKNNLRLFGQAVTLYSGEHRNDMPEGNYPKSQQQQRTWLLDLSPYLDYEKTMFPVVDDSKSFWFKNKCKGIEINGRYAVPGVLSCGARDDDGYMAYGWNNYHITGQSNGSSWKRLKNGFASKNNNGKILSRVKPDRQMIMGDNNNNKKGSATFALGTYNAGGAYMGLYSKRHLSSGETGGNYLFLDGHADYRTTSFLLSKESKNNFWFAKE